MKRRPPQNVMELDWIRFAEDYARVRERWSRVHNPSKDFILSLLYQLTRDGGLTDNQWEQALTDFRLARWLREVRRQRYAPHFPLYRIYKRHFYPSPEPYPQFDLAPSKRVADDRLHSGYARCDAQPLRDIHIPTDNASDGWGLCPESVGQSDPWGEDDPEWGVDGEEEYREDD